MSDLNDPDIKEAYDRWWRDHTLYASIRRPELVTEAFSAGWFAAQENIKAASAEIVAALQKMRDRHMPDLDFKRGQYLVVRVDGSKELIDHKPTLRDVYRSIGANHIDTVIISFSSPSVANLVMIVDDTGRVDGKPQNDRASEMAGTMIYGDAAIVHDQDFGA